MIVSKNLSGKEVRVLDLVGNVIFDQVADGNQIYIDTLNFHSGVYLVEFEDEHKKYTEKLIIE